MTQIFQKMRYFACVLYTMNEYCHVIWNLLCLWCSWIVITFHLKICNPIKINEILPRKFCEIPQNFCGRKTKLAWFWGLFLITDVLKNACYSNLASDLIQVCPGAMFHYCKLFAWSSLFKGMNFWDLEKKYIFRTPFFSVKA